MPALALLAAGQLHADLTSLLARSDVPLLVADLGINQGGGFR